MASIYRGFSTAQWLANGGKSFKITNMEAVKADIMNHIFTAPGDRVTLPDWGTRIPLMAFEPNDEITRQIIYDDLTMVIDYDPRVKLIDLQLITLPDNNAIVAYVDVLYVEFQVQGTLNIAIPVGTNG